VSGNAQYISKGRMVSHGTLLFCSDLSHVSDALNVKASKIVSKGIKSVRSRVANISEFLAEPMDIETFRAYILKYIFAGAAEVPEMPLNENDWAAVHKLADERYRSWDWNYGRSPDFNLQKTERFACGEIDVRMDVQQGVIQAIKFYGDYFSEVEPETLERRLVGVRYRREDVTQALQELQIGKCFTGMDLDTFIEFIL
jgi:lipoate---protein ligase